MQNAIRTPSGRIVPSRHARVFPHLRLSGAVLAALAASFCVAPGPVAAERSLAGSWSGGGWVSFAGGSRERARCRVHYAALSATRFRLSATCATESGRVSQVATVRKSGGSSYAGSFYNREYDVSGSIYITVRGNSQTATLRSESGSAVLSLHR
jgi:hypothetical protein